MDEGDLVGDRRALLGLPGEVDVVHIGGYNLRTSRIIERVTYVDAVE